MLSAEAALTLAQVEIRDRSDASCVAQNKLCPGWIVDNFDRYTGPLTEHIVLVLSSVAIGFVIAFALALVAHRERWLVGPIVGLTGVLYTLPSLALFFLLLPITGRGTMTAVIALTAYTLQIIFRNIVIGLDGVPLEAKDAGRGMGLTERQLLWRVELPLALPDIIAGLQDRLHQHGRPGDARRLRGRRRARVRDRRRQQHHLQDRCGGRRRAGAAARARHRRGAAG